MSPIPPVTTPTSRQPTCKLPGLGESVPTLVTGTGLQGVTSDVGVATVKAGGVFGRITDQQLHPVALDATGDSPNAFTPLVGSGRFDERVANGLAVSAARLLGADAPQVLVGVTQATDGAFALFRTAYEAPGGASLREVDAGRAFWIGAVFDKDGRAVYEPIEGEGAAQVAVH